MKPSLKVLYCRRGRFPQWTEPKSCLRKEWVSPVVAGHQHPRFSRCEFQSWLESGPRCQSNQHVQAVLTEFNTFDIGHPSLRDTQTGVPRGETGNYPLVVEAAECLRCASLVCTGFHPFGVQHLRCDVFRKLKVVIPRTIALLRESGNPYLQMAISGQPSHRFTARDSELLESSGGPNSSVSCSNFGRSYRRVLRPRFPVSMPQAHELRGLRSFVFDPSKSTRR